MKPTQLAAIISAMHRPVGGVLPAILQPSNPKKITKSPQRRAGPDHKTGQIEHNGPANPATSTARKAKP